MLQTFVVLMTVPHPEEPKGTLYDSIVYCTPDLTFSATVAPHTASSCYHRIFADGRV